MNRTLVTSRRPYVVFYARAVLYTTWLESAKAPIDLFANDHPLQLHLLAPTAVSPNPEAGVAMASTVVANVVIPGFSLTNRCLMYTSMMLSPAHAYFSMDSRWPCSWGFIAFNFYQQHIFFEGAKTNQLHALSLLPVYLNTIHYVTFFGGLFSGHPLLDFIQWTATTVLVILDVIIAFKSLPNPDAPNGYGVYQFFFFGYQTLSKGWGRVFLCWQFLNGVVATVAPRAWIFCGSSRGIQESELIQVSLIIRGTGWLMLALWPFVLWTELIVKRNNIVSETDTVSVSLFALQVGTMIVPWTLFYVRTSLWPPLLTRIPYHTTRRDVRAPDLLPMARTPVTARVAHPVTLTTTHTVTPPTARTATVHTAIVHTVTPATPATSHPVSATVEPATAP